jgi:hypothetical protein
MKGVELISMEFRAYQGTQQSFDAVNVHRASNMKVGIEVGTHGGITMASRVVSVVPGFTNAPPGLVTIHKGFLFCSSIYRRLESIARLTP